MRGDTSCYRDGKRLRNRERSELEDKLREFAETLGEKNSPMREGFLDKAKRFFDI